MRDASVLPAVAARERASARRRRVSHRDGMQAWRRRLLTLAAATWLAGCTSVPQAIAERDAEAKHFIPRPDAATIYVYRDDNAAVEPALDGTVLYVGGRLIGATLPATYFRFDVREGEHLLQGYAYDQGSLKIDTRFGEIYFVSLHSTNGTSRFMLVTPETGKRDILRCCALLENWAPEQRPLLR